VSQRWLVFAIPKSGLFFKNGAIVDGEGTVLKTDTAVPLHNTEADAIAHQAAVAKIWPNDHFPILQITTYPCRKCKEEIISQKRRKGIRASGEPERKSYASWTVP
jgi:deoxycytidylate deaminase